MIIELDMYQTLAIAVVVLMLGKFLRKKCSLLEKFCIPAPVVGGVLFAVFTCVCYVTGIRRPIFFWRAKQSVHLRVLCDRHCGVYI